MRVLLILMGLVAGVADGGCSYRRKASFVHQTGTHVVSKMRVGAGMAAEADCASLCDAQPHCFSFHTNTYLGINYCTTTKANTHGGGSDANYVTQYKESCPERRPEKFILEEWRVMRGEVFEASCDIRQQANGVTWHSGRTDIGALHANSLEECRLLCGAIPSCVSFLRQPPLCWFNAAVAGAPTSDANYDNYAKARCPAAQPVCEFLELPGGYARAARTEIVADLQGMANQSDCAQLCATQPHCAFYTFDTVAGACSTSSGMRSGATRSTDARFVTGWRVGCNATDGTPIACASTRKEHHPSYSRVDVVEGAQMDSEETCRAVCETLEVCVAWVWEIPTQRCYLSSSINNAAETYNEDYVSGMKTACSAHPLSAQATYGPDPDSCHLHHDPFYHHTTPRTLIVDNFRGLSAKECSDACLSHPRCFTNIFHSDEGNCYLTAHTTGQMTNGAGYRSFSKAVCIDRAPKAKAKCEYLRQDGGEYASPVYIFSRVVQVASRTACEDICDSLAPRCVAYNLHMHKWGNNAGMRTYWCATMESLSGGWSASVELFTGLRQSCGPSPPGKCFFGRRGAARYLNGRSVLVPEAEIADEEACQEACLATPGCVGYESRQPADHKAYCTLLDQMDLSAVTNDADAYYLKHDSGWLTYCGDDVWTKGYTRLEEMELFEAGVTEYQLANVPVADERECRRLCDAATTTCRGYAYRPYQDTVGDTLPTCHTYKTLGKTFTPAPGTGSSLRVVALKRLPMERVGGVLAFKPEAAPLPATGLISSHSDVDDFMCGYLCGESDECHSFGLDGSATCRLYSVGAELGPVGPTGTYFSRK